MGYVVCNMWGLVERLVPKDRTVVGAIHELPLQVSRIVGTNLFVQLWGRLDESPHEIVNIARGKPKP